MLAGWGLGGGHRRSPRAPRVATTLHPVGPEAALHPSRLPTGSLGVWHEHRAPLQARGAAGEGHPKDPLLYGLWGCPQPSARVRGAEGRLRALGASRGGWAKLPGNQIVAGAGGQRGGGSGPSAVPCSRGFPGRRRPHLALPAGQRGDTVPKAGHGGSCGKPGALQSLGAGSSSTKNLPVSKPLGQPQGWVLCPAPSVTCSQGCSLSSPFFSSPHSSSFPSSCPGGPRGYGRASHQEGQRRERAGGLRLDGRCWRKAGSLAELNESRCLQEPGLPKHTRGAPSKGMTVAGIAAAAGAADELWQRAAKVQNSARSDQAPGGSTPGWGPRCPAPTRRGLHTRRSWCGSEPLLAAQLTHEACWGLSTAPSPLPPGSVELSGIPRPLLAHRRCPRAAQRREVTAPGGTRPAAAPRCPPSRDGWRSCPQVPAVTTGPRGPCCPESCT